MTMMAFKMTIFLLFCSFGIQIVEVSGIVPGTSGNYPADNLGIENRIKSMAPFLFDTNQKESLTYLGISLATFGLLVLTLTFTIGILVYGWIIGSWYIIHLSLPWEWATALSALLAIIYAAGYTQYKANSSYREPV